MAPCSPLSTGRDRKVRSIIDFTVDLQNKLPVCHDPRAIDLLICDVGQHAQTVQRLSQPSASTPTSVPTKAAKELERQGRNLWNLSVRLKRENSDDSVKGRARLLVRSRVFAFQVLEFGYDAVRQKRDDEAGVVYLLNLTLTLGRLCIADADLDSARLVLQKAADYVERLKDVADNAAGDEQVQARRNLEAEYLTMRTALSWKEDRLDVAEHMFSKVESLRNDLGVSCAETLADTLHNIGAGLSSKGDHAIAIKWLKRAYELIGTHALDHLSTHGLELRLAICQGLVQSLLEIGSAECLQEANDLVAYVGSELGDKPVILHWQLEILQKSPEEVFDAEAYASILRRMVRSFDFSDGTFHFMLYHIKELRDKSSRLACALLDELLTHHVLSSGRLEWINKVVVRRIWMATMESNSRDTIDGLASLLDSVLDAVPEPLSPDVAGAVHSLIWKKLAAVFTKKRYETATKWCKIALHPLFSACGESNMGKFGRKQILCALSLNDSENALTAFQAMPKGAQNDILTVYLMFKVSLVTWDHDLGCQSIESLSKSADKTQTRDILYACIKEAQQVGDKLCTLAALKAVADSPGSADISCNLPSILRCTIRLIHLIESQESAHEKQGEKAEFVEDICEIFGKAAAHAKRDPRDASGNKIFTIPELHWFRKNAYNIGASKCHIWELPHLIRIFSACLTLTDCYPKDLSLSDNTELVLMALRCHFVIAAASVSLARTEDLLEEQLQRYLETRQHVASFDDLLQSEVGSEDETVIRDLVAKMATLFVFDFEGAVALKSWNDLGEIVRKAKMARDEVMYKAMGDCLLRSQAPSKILFATMRLIINEIHELENFDNERLAKYIRCMFQAILPLDDDLALQLVDQALQIAREGDQMGKPFPTAELEWLVATAFNHAVDFYARGDEKACHGWALKAMDLAEYLGDKGALRDVLMNKFAKLRIGGDAGGRAKW